MNGKPHLAQNTSRCSAIDGCTTRHAEYPSAQRVRKRIEESFGWIKTTGGLRTTRLAAPARVGWMPQANIVALYGAAVVKTSGRVRKKPVPAI